MLQGLRRIIGATLILIAGAIVYFGTIIMHKLGDDLPLLVLLAAVFPFGIGWFLLSGAKFFPDKEDTEQESWHDDDSPPR